MIPVVAIDGPAASGKSSTASEVARRLGYLHVDSGALYRAVTLVALERGGAAAGAEAVLGEAERRGVRLAVVEGQCVAMVDGRPVDDRIRTGRVTAEVSPVSALPAVRDWINWRLRALVGEAGPVVMDGRDIGTAVFPDAAVKVFLTAEPAVRAARRLRQRGEEPADDALSSEAEQIAARDRADADRAVAPLRPAPDAVVIDTSRLSFEEQVARIVGLAASAPLPPSGGDD